MESGFLLENDAGTNSVWEANEQDYFTVQFNLERRVLPKWGSGVVLAMYKFSSGSLGMEFSLQNMQHYPGLWCHLLVL